MSEENMVNDLEDKIVENIDLSEYTEVKIEPFVHVYSSISFLDTDALKDYIEDCMNDKDEEFKMHEVISIINYTDDGYIVGSSERVTQLAKEWLEEEYPTKKFYIAEDENAVPILNKFDISHDKIDNSPVTNINQAIFNDPLYKAKDYQIISNDDFTNNTYLIIANFNEDVNSDTCDIECNGDEFLSNHKTILIDTYMKDTSLPKNIAVIIGNPSPEYAEIAKDLKKINFSTTYLLINFTLHTDQPDLFSDVQKYLDNYINTRYGIYGIDAHVNIVPADHNSSEVYFYLDMHSNIPTTIIHSDIQAFVASYCMNIEFEYNRKK